MLWYFILWNTFHSLLIPFHVSSHQLEKPVRAEGSVELWLMKLLVMAQQSVHGIVRQAYHVIQDQDLNMLRFMEQFPAQVTSKYKCLQLSRNAYPWILTNDESICSSFCIFIVTFSCLGRDRRVDIVPGCSVSLRSYVLCVRASANARRLCAPSVTA